MRSRLVALAVALVAAGGALLPARAADPAPPRHALLDVTGVRTSSHVPFTSPAISDGIGPGSALLIDFDYEPDGEVDAVGLCTANYLWRDRPTGAVYLGAAGHCFLPQASDPGGERPVATHSDPWVRRVRVCVRSCAFGGGTTLLTDGVLAGEWKGLGPVRFARQFIVQRDEQGEPYQAEVGHDFGVVAVPPTLHRLLRASMPQWGGPTGTTEIGFGVCLYGNGLGVGESHLTKPRNGLGLFEDDGAWFAAVASNQGDSGSAVNDCGSLKAVGVLTHLTALGVAGTTVARAVEMAREGGLDLALITRL